MKIKEQLKEMFQMQRTLNKSILDEFGEESMTEEKLELAIIDELGELTHELKGDWCWWKKSQAPVNRQRVLEELVDVYHFVMTWEMLDNENLKIEDLLYYYSYYISRFGNGVQGDLNDFINNVSIENDKLQYLLDLTERLGFSFDDVYQEYLNKNKINYERLKNGY